VNGGSREDVTFSVSGKVFTVPRRQAELLAENLRLFARGKFPRDVKATAQVGVNPNWDKEGALPMAEVVEDVLTGRMTGPIPLAEGKGAEAMLGALSLITDVQPEQSGAIGLRDALRELLLS
jgi:hypothetical protein